MRRLILVLISLALSGCATSPAVSQISGITIDDDKFSQSATINGTEFQESQALGTSKIWMVRSFVNKNTGNVEHQLYITFVYSGSWRFYSYAADDQANKLSVIQISNNISTCTSDCVLDETIGVDLNDNELQKHQTTGYEIKITAKNGASSIFILTPDQITAQLVAVSDYKKTHKPNGV